ncbi:MAG: TM2 domain-containing protein, partial [Clostridia bacterium]|nr:TM2 domain-containing protein [Clostridia bacterium]
MESNQNNQQPQIIQPVQRSKCVAFLLCWFLGCFGAHRFYTGKIWTAILYILTGGLCGIGTFID